MTVRERVPLAPCTSLGVGGAARFLCEARTPHDLQEAWAIALAHGLPLRVLGAGTNILVPDAGVDAVVVRMTDAAHELAEEGPAVRLTAGAGASWDALVTLAAENGLWGIENLAGIPGSAGGALVQNIGAYGAEFSRVFLYADVFDLARGEERRVTREEARLAYRTSLFKGQHDLVIMSITLRLARTGEPELSYADLVRQREAGTPLRTPGEVAAAVRAIRSRKFPPTGCAGSFFKNPVITPDAFEALQGRYPGLPGYAAEGGVKIPLAFLLDRALGLAGYQRGPARLFERQPLVIVASEGARAHDVEQLAQDVEARVREVFAVTLEREVETFA